MKIITWNIRHGGGTRIDKIINTIYLEKGCDIFILTEFRNNQNRKEIENAFINLGFKFIITTESSEKLNSVIIASKYEFESETFDELNEHKQRVIKIKCNDIIIYGCYFPGQDLKKYVFEFLVNELKNKGSKNVIITGDINTGKHYLDEKGATFYHSNYLEVFENYGLVDAWRVINNDLKEYTWYSNIGNGFRIDHFYIDHLLREKIKDCYYIHKYREDKISDHSMMVLGLK